MRLHRLTRACILAGTAATALSISATAVAASAPALADDTADTPAVNSAVNSAVKNVVLEVGATDSEVHLTWMSDLGHQYEQAIIAKASDVQGKQFPDNAQRVDAAGELTGSASRVYDATVTGLEPGTEYTYAVGSDAHGWSAPETFTTNESSGDWNFLFFGDPQVGASYDLDADTKGWKKALETATAAHPDTDFLLSAGDQVNDVSQAQHDAFKSPAQLRQFPLAVNDGNHDNRDFHMYRQNYSWPNVSDEVKERDYYFERGNALIVSLDSNLSSSADIDSHKEYLRQVIGSKGADKDWVVVTYHHSPFSQAYHQNDGDVKRLREGLTPVMSELGVDAVLGGHDHIYTRSYLMEGTKPVVPEEKPAAGDVLHPQDGQVLYMIASSASGSKFYDFWADGKTYKDLSEEEAAEKGLTAPFTARWNQDRTPDYTNVEVTANTLTLTTYNVDDGSIVDKVTLAKDGADAGDSGAGNGDGADNGTGADNSTGDGGHQPGGDQPGGNQPDGKLSGGLSSTSSSLSSNLLFGSFR